MCNLHPVLHCPYRETKAHSAVQKISDYEAREKVKVEVTIKYFKCMHVVFVFCAYHKYFLHYLQAILEMAKANKKEGPLYGEFSSNFH